MSKLKKILEPTSSSFETFRSLTTYHRSNMIYTESSCFNGFVNVQKYRISCELIEEPKEVYQTRLQKLWDECDNHHHWQPLKNEANKLGVILIGEAGSKKPKRK